MIVTLAAKPPHGQTDGFFDIPDVTDCRHAVKIDRDGEAHGHDDSVPYAFFAFFEAGFFAAAADFLGAAFLATFFGAGFAAAFGFDTVCFFAVETRPGNFTSLRFPPVRFSRSLQFRAGSSRHRPDASAPDT